MKLIPRDVEEKLGFGLVRRRLEGLAFTAAGRERIEGIRPLSDRLRIETLFAQTAELQNALRLDDPLPISGIPDVRDALRRAQPRDSVLDGEQLAEIRTVLGVLRLCRAYFRSRREKYPQIATGVLEAESPEDLEHRIGQVVDDRGRVRDDASAELTRIKRALARTHGQLDAALLRALREAAHQGYAAEEQPTIRHGRAVIPVRAEAKRKVRGFVHDVSGSGQTVYIEPEAVLDLNNDVRELELEHGREIRRLLLELTGYVRSRLPQLHAGLDMLAWLDERQARARLANELDALVPELNDDGHVRIVRGRNPALLLHFRHKVRTGAESREERPPRKVVPLDLELSDEIRTIIITGPNAGGKSVALKTTGLCCLMASCGMPVPCGPGTTLPVFEKLFVDIGDQQSIENDLSTFTSHLTNLRGMLAEADRRSLVLIDEAGTGTDPAEGGALAEAVLRALTERGARSVATTHHGTLKAFAHTAEHVENASMEFDRSSLMPTYVFRSGVPGSSYAFEIAARVGLSDEVIGHARELVGEHKAALEELIASLDVRSQELSERLKAAEDKLHRAEQAKRSFEGRDRNLKRRREEILEEALVKAEGVLAEANARVERTIREIREAEAETEKTRQARADLEEYKANVKRERRTSRRAAERLQPQPTEPDKAWSGKIVVGDQVKMEGNDALGEVIEIAGGEVVVALGQMRMRTSLDRLRKVGSAKGQQVEVRIPRQESGKLPALETSRRIDVRGRRVEEAITEVERLVDQALAAGVERVEVLHGKGTGALRQAIQEYLRSRADVSAFEDAEWNAGGTGVTNITL